jgi:predicted HTH transcriptional regulator
LICNHMNPVIISIILTAAIIAIAVIVAWREARKYGTTTKEELVGICVSAIETASQKETRKQKALAMIQELGELSNAEIRKMLGVSSRTTVRYLDELEREDKVEQVGTIGQSVTYRLR